MWGNIGSVLGSPSALIATISTTVWCLTAYHYRHRHVKYQDPVILGAVGVGGAAGMLLKLDGMSVLFGIIPWCVFAAMLISTFWSVNVREDGSWMAVTTGRGTRNMF
jgi:Ca2+/Na+ antiporter